MQAAGCLRRLRPLKDRPIQAGSHYRFFEPYGLALGPTGERFLPSA